MNIHYEKSERMELIHPDRFHKLMADAWISEFTGWDFHWLKGRLIEDPLPFNSDRFDWVINRHDDFNPEEVFHVLKSGGLFITRQVGGLDNLELNPVLEDRLSFPFTTRRLANALSGL